MWKSNDCDLKKVTMYVLNNLLAQIIMLFFQLSDDMKRLETDIDELKKANEALLIEKNSYHSNYENLKKELDLTIEVRDQFQLEKDENSIKVLILEFEKLTIH